ncbi:hypothetical protein [Mesorhizobium sp. Z1-4]|uniref:hypothetical protein n=1 Tax=Mesorhizobium sp. Z1-4 TaxID=2448478 RepID=UPI000FDA9671|nr:hypothetical protein [Mesorhizobium sp. Z1-4]
MKKRLKIWIVALSVGIAGVVSAAAHDADVCNEESFGYFRIANFNGGPPSAELMNLSENRLVQIQIKPFEVGYSLKLDLRDENGKVETLSINAQASILREITHLSASVGSYPPGADYRGCYRFLE